ncbi:hypothetical protein LB456_01425 [Psychroflexus sp. CAK57W]|uniref:hypothetical protein n=1 Tax=Psychroflexus curvus TaxID=2873595 RepID=UPI001CCEC134|nr:hypothetical protein [Psychroflexus curvus]MBZ9627619.1 hypothetical protein [Psychroflexus curvus]MBZ9786106.1 hypothetical protein [Psychroflexus curvus]
MKSFQLLIVFILVFNSVVLTAQTDFDRFEARPVVSLSFNMDPFSTTALGREFNLPEVDIFKDRFAERAEINMVEAANKKAYRAEQGQERKFSFVERQSAMFSKFKPKFDNSSASPYAPSYHQQPIYSELNRVKNSAYEDLGDKFNRMSPFYQLSPYRRSSRPVFYISR